MQCNAFSASSRLYGWAGKSNERKSWQEIAALQQAMISPSTNRYMFTKRFVYGLPSLGMIKEDI
jgi:hypothetical protein